jgi:hypothetical protein
MTKIKNILAAALLLVATMALAAPVPYSSYSAGTTNGATALSWAIIGANSVNAGTPIVTAIDATTDLLTAKVQFHTITNSTQATHSNSTVTLPVGAGNISAGTIIIRHLLTDTYEKRTLTTATGTTNLVVTVAPGEAVVPGDMIYFTITAGAPSFGVTTNTYTITTTGCRLQIAGERLAAGQKGFPLLGEINGTSAAALNNLTAKFE